MKILTILLFGFFISTAPLLAQHTEYYSTIRFVETPLSEIEGSIPLSKNQALTRHHYRFNYSDTNQLISIEFYNGHTPKSPNHTASLFTLAHRMEFTSDGFSSKISFYDTNNNPTQVLGNTTTFVYELDEHGLRKALFFEDANGNRIENGWGIYNYTWNYHREGYIIEDRFNQQGEQMAIRPGFEFYRLKLFFSPSGSIRLMQNIDRQGNLVENESGAAQDLITVNSDGNFVKWEVLDKAGDLEKGNGPNVAIGIQDFNEFGYETGLVHKDEAKNVIYSDYGIARSLTSYDRFGNLSERTFIGPDGTPSPHQQAGYTHLKIQYDETGNFRTQLSYYDSDWNPIPHKTRGYASVKYRYNDLRRLVRIEYLDTRNKLVNRMDNGAAIIQYSYDQNGDRSEVILLNKNSEVIQ